jgi:hypothetical protein
VAGALGYNPGDFHKELQMAKKKKAAKRATSAKRSAKKAGRARSKTVGSSEPVVKALDRWIAELRSLISTYPELASVADDAAAFRENILCRPMATGVRNHVPRPFKGRPGQ